jgi:hypothetical protein
LVASVERVGTVVVGVGPAVVGVGPVEVVGVGPVEVVGVGPVEVVGVGPAVVGAEVVGAVVVGVGVGVGATTVLQLLTMVDGWPGTGRRQHWLVAAPREGPNVSWQFGWAPKKKLAEFWGATVIAGMV